MKKRLYLIIAAVAVMALVLAGCSASSFSIILDDDTGVEITAENADADSSGQVGAFTVGGNETVVFEPALTEGTVLVQFVQADGIDDMDVDFEELTGLDAALEVEVSGADPLEYSLDAGDYIVAATVTEKANGTIIVKTAPSYSASESETGIANPWSDADSAAAAAEGAGVGTLALPEEGSEINGGEIHFFGYRYMDGLAEADGGVGAAELTVRKGLAGADLGGEDESDISGDYNAYSYSWTVDANGSEVRCFGNEEGQTMKALWSSDSYNYCILVRGQGDVRDTYGLGDEDIVALVGIIG